MDKPIILVVEDEKDVSKVISINLKLEGMDVIEAYDGPSALKKMEEVRPNCVVLDIILPKISGWDILEQIKSNPQTADIPVVMVTAKIGERDQLRGLGAGAIKYITKPFSPMSLTEAIKSILKPQAQEDVERERREAIERLQLSTLYKISDILISAPVLDELLQGVADKLIDLFYIPACALILSNQESEIYTFKETEAVAGKGKSISRKGFPPEIDERIENVFSTNRRPVKISETEGLNLDEIFPVSEAARDGYLVPLFERDNYLGSIVIALDSDVTLSLDEKDLLATIANQLAAAVVRARLHEVLKEDEIVHRRLLHQCIKAAESERRKVASEIHDSVVQSLVGMSYRLQAIEKKIPSDTNQELFDDIKLLEEQLNENIVDLRELLIGLRPPMLDDMGLFAALETHLKKFGIKNKIQTSLQLPEELPTLTKDAQTNLFRLVQEALNNIEKHAKASRVTIQVESSTKKLYLSVRDDGKGFPIQRGRGRPRHLGIASMQERAELLKGNIEMKSEPGRGTVVSLSVPLREIVEG